MQHTSPVQDEDLEQILSTMLKVVQSNHVLHLQEELAKLTPEFEALNRKVQSRNGIDYLEHFKELKLRRNALIGQYKSVETAIGRNALVRAMTAIISDNPELMAKLSTQASTDALSSANRLAERRKVRWAERRERKRELSKGVA